MTAPHGDLDDMGRGADLSDFEATNAYGVMGMRERARHFGGTLDIWSQPSRGCRLTLLMPLAADLPAAGSLGSGL